MRVSCIEWTGTRTGAGYGQVSIKGKRVYAHRAIYERLVEPIPAGLCVLHTCDNPACINVSHLILGSQRDNIRDMNSKGRARGGVPKLSMGSARVIRHLVEEGVPQNEVAKIFSVSKCTVSDVVNLKRWFKPRGGQ